MFENSRKVVLLVDDDDMHLTVTEMSLKDEYDVYKVESGAKALELLSKKQIVPEIILLDILMPEMDGWVVFDKINDIAALKFTPVMFFSSLNDDEAKEKAYALGAFDYVTKPCPREVLRERVKATLQKAELKKKEYGV